MNNPREAIGVIVSQIDKGNILICHDYSSLIVCRNLSALKKNTVSYLNSSNTLVSMLTLYFFSYLTADLINGSMYENIDTACSK